MSAAPAQPSSALRSTSRAPAAPSASPPDRRSHISNRVEWLTSDPFSAMAAPQNGEIDWWEAPPRDLLEQIARNRNIALVS
jgi:peptide/nickel transport system substrate-binding protein